MELRVSAHGEAHIDAIGIAGKTFRNTEEGEVIGLLSEKRAGHIQARGGVYTEGGRVPFEMGHRYLSTILTFLGIRKAEHVYLEGHAMFPERAPDIRDRGIEQARQLADSF